MGRDFPRLFEEEMDLFDSIVGVGVEAVGIACHQLFRAGLIHGFRSDIQHARPRNGLGMPPLDPILRKCLRWLDRLWSFEARQGWSRISFPMLFFALPPK